MITSAGRRRIPLLLLFPLCSLGGLALTGCGNKGPLYLPPPPVEQQGSPLEEAPAEDAQASKAE